jgi:glycine/D-amino acid oxidase-like deaminating enzyme
MKKQYDHIIIGQGICGTFLSYYLQRVGKKVLVIDEVNASSASRVASGVINPVTGRSVVTTWMAETLLPFAEMAYKAIGNVIKEKVLLDAKIAAFTSTEQMQNAFEKRLNEENSYIKKLSSETYSELFHISNETYLIEPSYVIDLHALLDGWRKHLTETDSLLNESFDEKELGLNAAGVSYKEITAESIIYCNGISSFQSKYWSHLPYALNKGQALIIQTELPRDHVYKFGAMSLVPWDNDTWWVGSSYENNYETESPTEGFRSQAEMQLKAILKKQFKVIDHISGVRPAVIVERRPFVGFHPSFKRVGILNGMGTKGCSLAPYFSHQFAEYIISNTTIEPSADVMRFKRILSESKPHN